MDDGVAGLEAMNAEGVLGGSTLGIAFLHASTKLESLEASAGRSVENGRRHLIMEARERNREPCRNIVVGLGNGDQSGLQNPIRDWLGKLVVELTGFSTVMGFPLFWYRYHISSLITIWIGTKFF